MISENRRLIIPWTGTGSCGIDVDSQYCSLHGISLKNDSMEGKANLTRIDPYSAANVLLEQASVA